MYFRYRFPHDTSLKHEHGLLRRLGLLLYLLRVRRGRYMQLPRNRGFRVLLGFLLCGGGASR